ncbi:hypothetical protein ACFYY1_30245 [Streptomyces sp. NPDC001890]|uniref:hypothetical protein n=1 Tax=Streptomyces sp. NPDC001890 TaxID=3364620 RepID=UPI0036778DAB
MPKKKRHKKQREVYRDPSEPYTGISPGMDRFIALLPVYFLDKSEDQTLRSWEGLVSRNPVQASEELKVFQAVVANPPPDLVDIMKQYGSVYLYDWIKSRRVPRTPDEYERWLRKIVSTLTTSAGDRLPEV